MEEYQAEVRTGEGHYDPEKGAPVFHGLAEAKGYDQSHSRVEKLKYSHEAMIDALVAQPRITQNELASRFGYTPAWVSRVIGSDAFQAALAKRRQEIADPFLIASMDEMLSGLARQSIEVLTRKLEATDSADLALKTADLSLKAAGFGMRDRNPGNIVNNFVVALPGKAPSAEDWAAKAANGGYLPAIDHAPAENISTTVTRDPTVQPEPTKLADSED